MSTKFSRFTPSPSKPGWAFVVDYLRTDTFLELCHRAAENMDYDRHFDDISDWFVPCMSICPMVKGLQEENGETTVQAVEQMHALEACNYQLEIFRAREQRLADENMRLQNELKDAKLSLATFKRQLKTLLKNHPQA